VADAYGDLQRWPTRPDYLDHELEHGRLVVGEDGGRIVGFGATLERGGITYLADLFVLPDRLGRGIGAAIMGALFPDPGDRFTFASSDPRTRPLYTRFGMRPLGRLLYLGAPAAITRRLGGPDIAPAEVPPAQVAELDARASGRERPQDLEFLGAHGTFLASGSAYGYVRVTGQEALLNPTGAAGAEGLTDITMAVARLAAARAGVVRVAVMESHPALPALLAAGFAVEEFDTYMSSKPDLVDGVRYGPSPVVG
jgi:acetyltransferase (GNAT) family protein